MRTRLRSSVERIRMALTENRDMLGDMTAEVGRAFEGEEVWFAAVPGVVQVKRGPIEAPPLELIFLMRLGGSSTERTAIDESNYQQSS